MCMGYECVMDVNLPLPLHKGAAALSRLGINGYLVYADTPFAQDYSSEVSRRGGFYMLKGDTTEVQATHTMDTSHPVQFLQQRKGE